MKYDELIWTSLELEKKRLLLLPVGSVEQHGLRLPFGVDSYLAEILCHMVSRKIESIVAPVISYGARSLPNSGGGESFPGTISIRGTALIEYYEDIVLGYLKAGFTTIVIINAHWENEAFIQEAIERLKEKKLLEGHKVVLFSWWSVLDEKIIKRIIPKFVGWKFEHAGRIEFALMLHYFPKLVGEKGDIMSGDLNVNPDIYTYPINKNIRDNYGALSSCIGVTKKMGENLANYTERSLLSAITDIVNDDK